jgi:hypothetical protein
VKAAQFDIVKHIRQDTITVGLETSISTGNSYCTSESSGVVMYGT